jgi:hypothetical protein
MKLSASIKIERLHAKASEIASSEVIRLARKILRSDKTLDEFVMGMGTWFFVDRYGRSWGELPQFKELKDFINKWDKDIRITGEPMRFTADGDIIRNW